MGINTIDFKTKTIIQPKQSPSVDGKWITGIDIGYSGCKIFSQNKVACFPCYARKLDGELFSDTYYGTDIFYRDGENGDIWAVGETAVSMMSSRDTNDNAASMYSRSRFGDPMFTVIMRAGLGLSLMGNSFGSYHDGLELYVETGLPAAYMNDEDYIKEIFCCHHDFSLKVGNAKWAHFSFVLDEAHVSVTSQPKGTLYSSIVGDNGEFVHDSSRILKSKTLIFDAGFNTLDLIRNINGSVDSDSDCVSYNNLGMKEVFTETAKEIETKYHEKVEIPYMQQVLSTGIVQGYDRRTKSTTEISIAGILEEKNRAVCSAAIEKIRGMYNDLLDFDYMIVTGGTGEAWWQMITEELKGLKTLTLLSGNENSDLPFTFSNVRGYYYFMYRTLRRRR